MIVTPGGYTRPGRALQTRKRCALQDVGQARKRDSGSIKRKRPVPRYSAGSDTDEDEPDTEQDQSAYGRRRAKCSRTSVQKERIQARSIFADVGLVPPRSHNGHGDATSSNPGHEEVEEELIVEFARSSEPEQGIDLSDIYNFESSATDADLYEEWGTTHGERNYGTRLWDRPDVQKYIQELPSLLTRRHRQSVLSTRAYCIDDEPLRVKFLNRQFKHRLNSGDFTESQIHEIILQRPMQGTFAELNIPTPRIVPESDPGELEFEDIDLGFEPLERPATPIPEYDSSEEDSDEEGVPVYAASLISQQLSRLEMEAMGIYFDDDD